MGVSFNTGFSGLSIPPASEQFQNSLKDKTNEDLVNMLGQGNLSLGDKLAIGKELASRVEANKEAEGAGGGGGGEGDELQKLLKKLQDGTISSEELKKLSGMLGVDVATLEKAKGKGEHAFADEPDITGG